MLASVSTILRGDMENYLEDIVRRMMETLTSEEGVKVRKLCTNYYLVKLDLEKDSEETIDV